MKVLFFPTTLLFCCAMPPDTHAFAGGKFMLDILFTYFSFSLIFYRSMSASTSSDVLTRCSPPAFLLVWTITTSTMTTSQQGNEYACGSYQNTMSRRSLFGVYSHQPNMSKYSYPSDVSLSSHYNGYTSWGLWREPGHLSPSIYSKRRINIRSFSILIMSAAFIVLLAVLSIAGLAFYFSTFKSDPIDCK